MGNGLTISPDLEAFTRLFGVHQTNGFMINLDGVKDVGTAIYLGPSEFDHSCDYNAIQTFCGKQISIKAVRDISQSEKASRLPNVRNILPCTYVLARAQTLMQVQAHKTAYYF